MHVVIDAQPLLEPLAGIGRCTSSILKALARIDSRNQYYLYYGASFRQSRAALPHFDSPNFHRKLIRCPGRVFRFLTEKLKVLPVGSLLGNYDLYHGLNYHVPRVAFPSIVNIYDLSYLLFPQYFTRKRLNDIRGKVASSIKRADKILTGSESAKADIVNFLKVPGKRIKVTPFGVEETFKPQSSEEVSLIRKKHNLPERFILFVGTIEPRKNIISLLRAYHKLVRSDVGLVIAGGHGWLFEEIFREVSRLNLREKVMFPGRVSETDLPALYSAASVFVYPSVYEGFGFPPLEAMACGVPVIVSNTSSLPEIVGDAGILVNPEDSSEIAEAIRSVLDDDSKRENMRTKGIERAKRFSWEKCAGETLRIYAELAG
jgi:glycosyltransferase involved in cell wall biosynthesis